MFDLSDIELLSSESRLLGTKIRVKNKRVKIVNFQDSIYVVT